MRSGVSHGKKHQSFGSFVMLSEFSLPRWKGRVIDFSAAYEKPLIDYSLDGTRKKSIFLLFTSRYIQQFR